MKKTEEYISELIEMRKENMIDPFNFALLKYSSWEVSLNARLKENAQDITPKVAEIVSAVVERYMDSEDIEKIAALQTELTKKYSKQLVKMDEDINTEVEEYIERYNEAVRRILESENKDNEPGGEENKNQ